MKSIYEILGETCRQLRKGEVLEGDPAMVKWAEGDPTEPAPGGVLEVFDMPPETDPAFDGFEKVDLFFVTIAVDKAKAEDCRADLIAYLDAFPDKAMLAGGPSYIAIGGVLGDQGLAFELFALGKVLGLWTIITPERMGATGETAQRMAGAGYIMASGYRPAEAA